MPQHPPLPRHCKLPATFSRKRAEGSEWDVQPGASRTLGLGVCGTSGTVICPFLLIQPHRGPSGDCPKTQNPRLTELDWLPSLAAY